MHYRGCTTEPLHFVLHKQTNFFKTLISLRHSDNRHSSPSVQKSNDIVLYSQKNPNTFPRPLRVYMIQSWLTLLTSLPIFSFLLILLAVPWTCWPRLHLSACALPAPCPLSSGEHAPPGVSEAGSPLSLKPLPKLTSSVRALVITLSKITSHSSTSFALLPPILLKIYP